MYFFLGQENVELFKGQRDYYQMWVLLTQYHITPKKWEEDFTPEEQNAFWTMANYQSEKAREQQFQAQSKAFHERGGRSPNTNVKYMGQQ